MREQSSARISGLALSVIAILGVLGALSIAGLVTDDVGGALREFEERELLGPPSLRDSREPSMGLVFDSWISKAYVASALAAFLTWLAWLLRAHVRLRALGERLVYHPKWWAVWFAVPFLNLVQPFFVVQELYLKSAPHTHGHAARRFLPLALPLGWWIVIVLTVATGIYAIDVHLAAQREILLHDKPPYSFVSGAVHREEISSRIAWAVRLRYGFWAMGLAATTLTALLVVRVSRWQSTRLEATPCPGNDAAGKGPALDRAGDRP